MKKILFVLLLTTFCSARAAANKAEISFDLSDVPIGQLVTVIYKDAFTTPFVLAPEIVADTRRIAFRFGGSAARIRRDLSRLLDSLGYQRTTRDGIDFIEKKMAEVATNEVFIYRPKFRDVNYLTELLRPLFHGQFTANRTISAPLGTKSDSPAPPGSAAALIDRAPDTLVFTGDNSEIAKLEKILTQVDFQVGEVIVRGVVYEVQTGERGGSAFSLAASILSGKVSVNLGQATLENSLKISIADADAAFSALASDNRFKVITQPSLRVRSGQEAQFSVGQDVPVLGAVTYQQNGAPVQSVEYRNSGVIFNLSPQVREGAVDLKVVQQLSNFVQTTTGVNASPTLIKREIKTQVQVREGEVIMLGGLTEDKETTGQAGLSFLPKWFGAKSRSSDRTELLLVLQLTRL